MIYFSPRQPRPMPSPSLRHNSFRQNFSVSSAFNVRRFGLAVPLCHLIRVLPDPIIIPAEFCQRYIEFINGRSGSLTIGGQLVAMLLVVWAASFGVDEYGVDNNQQGDRPNLRERKQNINEMVTELLVLFDIHGVMRKPSWDGVRALLLLLPLTEGKFHISIVRR